MAQLALYTLMLKTKYGTKGDQSSQATGSTDTGVLLYMNGDSFRAVHVAPRLGEIKSLVGQRNVVANETRRVSRPRGVVLNYEDRNLQNNQSSRQVNRRPGKRRISFFESLSKCFSFFALVV
jgi:hypothetical protein